MDPREFGHRRFGERRRTAERVEHAVDIKKNHRAFEAVAAVVQEEIRARRRDASSGRRRARWRLLALLVREGDTEEDAEETVGRFMRDHDRDGNGELSFVEFANAVAAEPLLKQAMDDEAAEG